MQAGDRGTIDRAGLQALVGALWAAGREVLGPVLRDGAVEVGPVRGLADLPGGTGDEQAPGRYRLRERQDDALFGFASTAAPWKSVFLPARTLLWQGRRGRDGTTVEPATDRSRPLALLGIRGCDLAAIGVQDRVLRDRVAGRPAADAHYSQARADVLVVAVACGWPADTCFCTSMGTGPMPGPGADLVLTELLDGEHRFLVEVRTGSGSAALADVPVRPATEADTAAAAQVLAAATERIGRGLDRVGLRETLLAEAEHPHWDDVAARCLACANCTLSCPTCFCSTVQDVSDLTGERAERWRAWDSCFTAGFSYVHGGSVRATTRSRYRQWLTHKLASWHDQFDTSGCVGCGRCITWCPVGIDLTAEAAALQAAARRPGVARQADREG